MNEENNQNLSQNSQGFAKKHCFLCTMARYITAFVLGVIVGLVWGQF